MTSFGKKELGDFRHGDECVAKGGRHFLAPSIEGSWRGGMLWRRTQ